MSATFYELLKFAKTGVAAPSMTAYDKLKALAMCGGGFPVNTLTGIPPISFKSDGSALSAWSIAGNMVQNGTPTPDSPITPQETGDLVASGEHAGEYAIQISCADTQTIYLSDPLRKIEDYADVVSAVGTVGTTTRRIKKIVFTGNESIIKAASNPVFTMSLSGANSESGITTASTHYAAQTNVSGTGNMNNMSIAIRRGYNTLYIGDDSFADVPAFKTWLAEQYAAGTPVTIWYVLATEQTGIVNEPLCKIGDYADELHSEDAGFSIPTAKGQNTLTIDTDLQPSGVSITGRIKAV